MKKFFTISLITFFFLAINTSFAGHEDKPKPKNNNSVRFTEDGTWTVQNSNFATASRGINYISAVSENVAWANGYDGVTPTNYIVEFTMTTNGGTTWTARNIAGYSTGWGPAMIYAVSGTTAWLPLFNATAGGGRILKTTDGGLNWVHQSTATFSAPAGFPNVIHFWNENEGVTMGDPNGGFWEMYTTTNGGTNWVRVPTGNLPAPVASDEYGVVGYYDVKGNTVWYTTNKSRIIKSTDKGFTWTAITTPIPVNQQFKIQMVDQNFGIAYVVQLQTKYFTTDGGNTWTQLTHTGPFFASDFRYVPGTQNSFVSVGAAAGFTGISYSLDRGANWTEFTGTSITQFTSVGFVDNYTGWAGSFNTNNTGGIFKFTGEIEPVPVELTSFSASTSLSGINLTWETATEVNNLGFEVQRSLDNISFATVAFIHGKGTTTERQTYTYLDKTTSEQKLYYRLKQVDLDGKFEFSNIIEVVFDLPLNFEMSQNFPNPFNPSTEIRFALPEAANVVLNVYNSQGELVQNLVNGVYSAGTHSTNFDAAKLNSGIYFYTIKAGNFTQTRKMMLLK